MALLVSHQMVNAAQKTVDRDSVPVPLNWPTHPVGSDALPPREAWVDPKNGKLDQDHLIDLLKMTTGTCFGPVPLKDAPLIHGCTKDETSNFPGINDYIVIHVVTWKDPAAGATTQDVDKQNWYVYNSGATWDDTSYSKNNRIFGRKSAYLFYLHFNRAANMNYNMRYEMQVTSKVPVFLDNLVKLGQLWGVNVTGAGVKTAEPSDVWGMVTLPIDYVPSDVTLTPMVLDATDGHTLTTMTAQKFDNEGKYHIDFSVAVPITKITDFNYVSSSNTLVPAQYNKQRMLAVFDYHPWAVDLKGSGFDKHPYLLTGVGLGSQPLQRALFGVGWGPAYANFYGGLLLNTRHVTTGVKCGQTPPATPAAGTTVGTQSCSQFSFGVNVGVGAVLDAMKNNTSSSKTAATTSTPSK